MNRRQFLQALGIGGAAIAAPKLIFDMGANLWKYTPEWRLINSWQSWDRDCRELTFVSGKRVANVIITGREMRATRCDPDGLLALARSKIAQHIDEHPLPTGFEGVILLG